MALNKFVDCPDCNEVFAWPAFDADQDCTTHDVDLSQICDLLIQPDGAPVPLAAWATTPTVVANTIDNTATTNAKCRMLTVIAGASEPEVESEPLPKGKSRVAKETTTILAEVLNLSPTQYDGLQKLSCGPTNGRLWYTDLGKKIYGKATGLEYSSLRVYSPNGNGATDKKRVFIEIKFDHIGLVDRRVSPFA